MAGWVKLHRCLINKPIWLTSTPEQKIILITLLLMANHEEREWEWQGKKFKVKPGQFITSLDSIAAACGSGVSIKNVRTALARFEKYEFLANESTKTGRLITVTNWGNYQADDRPTGKDNGKQAAKTRQTGGKQVATNKNDKNDNNDKKVNKKIYAQYVSLTVEEYGKLVDKFGEEDALDRIERLNLYKGSTGTKYNDDYLTILNWARKDKPKEVKQDAKPGDTTQPKYDYSKLYINGTGT